MGSKNTTVTTATSAPETQAMPEEHALRAAMAALEALETRRQEVYQRASARAGTVERTVRERAAADLAVLDRKIQEAERECEDLRVARDTAIARAARDGRGRTFDPETRALVQEFFRALEPVRAAHRRWEALWVRAEQTIGNNGAVPRPPSDIFGDDSESRVNLWLRHPDYRKWH